MRRLLIIHLIGCASCFLAFKSQASDIQVDSLLNRARDTFSSNLDSARFLEEKALSLAKSTNYSEGVVRAYYYLGYYYHFGVKDHQQAILNYLEATRYSSMKHDSTSLGWAIYANVNASEIFTEYGLTDISRNLLSKAGELAEVLGNVREINRIDFYRYKIKAKENRYFEALEILQTVLTRTDPHEKPYYDALNSLGISYAYLGDFEKSKAAYNQLIKDASANNRTTYEDYGRHNLADLLMKNGNWEEAEALLEAVLASKLSRTDETKRDGNLLKTYKDLLLTKLETNQPGFIFQIEDDLKNLLPYVKKTDPAYYFEIYPLMADAYSSLGKQDLAMKYGLAYENDSSDFLKAQNRLDFEHRKNELQEVVNNYYVELDEKRRAVRNENFLLSTIVGLSILVVILVSYHFLSRYRVRKMITENLERLNWDD